MFTSLKNMTIITPSNWLANLTQMSYLNQYPIKVIYNGIDLKKFRPLPSNFRQGNGLENKFIILTVAFVWNYRKGLDRICKIAENLNENYQLVIVGAMESKLEIKNTICIPRTDSQEKLAEIYSAANVFLNVTREDTFPTVNIEALACGIPIISYGACGSAEAFDKKTGIVANENTIIDLLEQIRCGKIKFKKENCIHRSKQFDQWIKYKEYLNLYENCR